MTRALPSRRPGPQATNLALPANVAAYAARSRAEATRKAYASDWRLWAAYAAATGASTLPASVEALCAYCVHMADVELLRVSTIRRRLASIAVAHVAAAYDPPPTRDPRVRAVVTGIARTFGERPHRKDPALLADLERAVAVCGRDLRGTRDRAVLLVGWAGAFRRAELAALRYEDLVAEPGGIRIRLEVSKTDQTRRGMDKGIPHSSRDDLCAACALVAWLEMSRVDEGFVFRRLVGPQERIGELPISGHMVARIVKRTLRSAGIVGDFAGHSLRRGLVTQAAMAGADTLTIMRQTGHRRVEQLAEYVASADVFTRNAATEAGL